MSKLIELKRRIKSTKNIKQITKAMEMVSIVKLRKAQELLEHSREYYSTIDSITKIIETYKDEISIKEEKNILLIIVTPSKGMIGALNLNIENKVKEFIETHKDKNIKIIAIDKKALNFIFTLDKEIIAHFPEISQNITMENIYPISDLIETEYIKGEIDSIYIIYPKFINIMTNEIITEKILPLNINEDEIHYIKEHSEDPTSIYEFEVPIDTVYKEAIRIYIESKIYLAITEKMTSEHSSRMIAMRNAADNATTLNNELTFESNKERQTKITAEVLEIASATNITE